MDVLWWDLGRFMKFEEMDYEGQKLYIESIGKLFEDYTNDKGYHSPS